MCAFIYIFTAFANFREHCETIIRSVDDLWLQMTAYRNYRHNYTEASVQRQKSTIFLNIKDTKISTPTNSYYGLFTAVPYRKETPGRLATESICEHILIKLTTEEIWRLGVICLRCRLV